MTYRFADPAVLQEIVRQQKQGIPIGIASVCSAHRQVLIACLRQALEGERTLLVEATCNQVNQYGGYTGLTPAAFAEELAGLATQVGFPLERLLLGGDHLGPYPWRKDSSTSALEKSLRLVEAYVASGFRKIHLDASMPCSDDLAPALPKVISARRTAALCAASERTARQYPQFPLPVYVIGSEVPVPGGSTNPEHFELITTPQDAAETLTIYQQEFTHLGLQDAWERVVALVVHPGVEFGDDHISVYNRSQTTALTQFIRQTPGMVFEAHSTDYQPPVSLRQMVEDQLAVLKVGPALTFAFRQAAFALEYIEQEWLGRREGVELSNLRRTLLEAMRKDPSHWAGYYLGSPGEVEFKQVHSYSDRIRYYWARSSVQSALERLLHNLGCYPPPLPLVSQFLPRQYARIQMGAAGLDPQEWIWNEIQESWGIYTTACQESPFREESPSREESTR